MITKSPEAMSDQEFEEYVAELKRKRKDIQARNERNLYISQRNSEPELSKIKKEDD